LSNSKTVKRTSEMIIGGFPGSACPPSPPLHKLADAHHVSQMNALVIIIELKCVLYGSEMKSRAGSAFVVSGKNPILIVLNRRLN
jgi:hypothetical protein